MGVGFISRGFFLLLTLNIPGIYGRQSEFTMHSRYKHIVQREIQQSEMEFSIDTPPPDLIHLLFFYRGVFVQPFPHFTPLAILRQFHFSPTEFNRVAQNLCPMHSLNTRDNVSEVPRGHQLSIPRKMR